MDQAQSSAVSITQAAAIIVGASAGSSIITLLIILCVLRYRRKKRREREGQAEDARGKLDNDGSRPGTSGSYNSMTAGTRDLKDQALMTGSTAVAAAPERFQSVRIVDVSRNGSKNSSTRVGAGGGGTAAATAATTTTTIKGGTARSKPESFLGERLSRLGITRRPTGEAFTTDYVQRADSVRKPVINLADPPAAAAKKDQQQQQDYGASSKTTPTFSVFPKIDPDPKGTMLKTVREESRPPSSGAALQAWLQTAEISPFGPLEPPPAKTSGGGGATDMTNNTNYNESTSKGAPGPARLTEVKWPLQDSSSNGSGVGVKRSATDASSRYSTQTEVAPEQGNIPVALVRDNPAAGTPQVVPGRMKGPGLPGSVRKVTTTPGSVRDVSALGREQRLGG